jgi:hypothetical protein
VLDPNELWTAENALACPQCGSSITGTPCPECGWELEQDNPEIFPTTGRTGSPVASAPRAQKSTVVGPPQERGMEGTMKRRTARKLFFALLLVAAAAFALAGCDDHPHKKPIVCVPPSMVIHGQCRAPE